jgi:hypothetical protein
MPLNLSLEFGIRNIQEKREGLKSNGTHEVLIYAGYGVTSQSYSREDIGSN